MDIKHVGSRGILFTFHDLGIATNVYVIRGKKRCYIIDTYLGPDVMQQINEYIMSPQGAMDVIVVNSHSHWDHVWGNSLYSTSLIISHAACGEHMRQNGLAELEKYAQYKKGDVCLTFPNFTFTDRICFEDDNILIYHTPGHTVDELSVLDIRDRVLFAGDNLERPVPSFSSKNLKEYVHTLEGYLDMEFQTAIGGHTGCEDKSLILHNLDYVKKVLSGDTAEFETGECAEGHRANVEWLCE